MDNNSNSNEIQGSIQDDIKLMLDHMVKTGIKIPPTVGSLSNPDLTNQINIYNGLSEAIAPSTISSINYVNNEVLNGDQQIRWYKIPIFTKCIVLAIIALLVLIGISLLPSVNQENQAHSLLESSGLILLYNLIFICASALLGVMFYLLKTISLKIKNHTLLPVDAIEINATIIIGVISGFIISELFLFTQTDIGGNIEIAKMTLALLGGFASDVIFTTLKSIVTKFQLLLSPQ